MGYLVGVMGYSAGLHPRCGTGVISSIPVKEWVIGADNHGILIGPGDTMCFPAYNGEAAHINGAACGLAVLVNRGGGFEVLF